MTYSDNLMAIYKPSYWLVVPFGIFALFLSFFGLPFLLLFTLYHVIDLYNWQYHFNERTIIERRGIFSVSYREINYARIKSVRVDRPFLFRLVGLWNISLISSDPYMPNLQLYAISDGNEIWSMLKSKTDFWRKSEGIKEFDMYNL